MSGRFLEVTTEAQLDEAFVRSQREPVLLYLHDPFCGLSSLAHQELSNLEAAVALVNVDAGRDLSRLIERRTGVRHESPQILLLRHGQARWAASHRKVTARGVLEALAAESGVPVDSAPPGQRRSLMGRLTDWISGTAPSAGR